MWTVAELSGRPLHPDLIYPCDLPYSISNAIALYKKYQSFRELPEPMPEEWYDFPDYVDRHIEKIYPHTKKSSYEVNPEEVDD